MNLMSDETVWDIAIIGGGVSGYAAGLYAGRFELKTIVFSPEPGGVIVKTDIVENYPGFELITGFDLAQKIQLHAEKFGVQTNDYKVDQITKMENGHFLIKTEEGTKEAKTVIFATGTKWKMLNVPGEEQYANRGVHYCALCDGAFYKDKVVGVIGGSDSAAKEALLLTSWAKKVVIIYRGEKIRPEPVNYTKVLANPKIEIIYQTNVTEIKGNGSNVTHVIFDKEHDGKNEFALDGLFVEIGHLPLSDLAKSLGVNLNKKGEIMIDKDSLTNVPGVYAAGDVCDREFKQAITGVAEGVAAAYAAYQYLENKK